ncbi:MAG: methylated-DNA--[protein]-cysteine S-methyltransferase [Spirochaetales bacterium]|nr:methylated-DNA--[protein]-cysteine S-methyltransferase [Spirochaetales bacterium]
MSGRQGSFEEKYALIASRVSPEGDSFYYGVKTTGIFCLPGCSSRLPKRENTVFFDTSDEALQAGFRPCKRCRPLQNRSDDKTDLAVAVCRIIEEAEEEPRLKDLAEATGYSESYLQRTFKARMGISPREYAQQIKAERFKEELDRGNSVSSSLYRAGYGSSSRVYENREGLPAMKPSRFKKGGEGIDFYREVFPCSLGFVLIAFTDKGLSAVQWGDSKRELEEDFSRRFKNAHIEGLSEDHAHRVQAILEKVEDPARKIDIPLDIHGTVFQKKVWKALREIPSGETRSYGEIAERIGCPRSVRAVAQACGKNEIALVIPCHRVIRKNGDLSGYRWGVERKAQLLAREGGVDGESTPEGHKPNSS